MSTSVDNSSNATPAPSGANDVRILFVTISASQAPEYVRTLCTERLVACGNIFPSVRSLYWWQGSLTEDEEAFIVMETTADRVADAIRRATELHPYTVPKILAIAPVAGSEDYARWLFRETRSMGEPTTK